ncbi:MAG TPA: c-type cytochrome, partial [Bryobacteraceae bacterium]|nr:c-type cytochrome [Bryobacteraceae bacterium]
MRCSHRFACFSVALNIFLSGIFAARAQLIDRNEPETHANILDHFKFGSIGAEERAGIPYWIWVVLPEIFPQHLPKRPGNGYEKFGFIFESGKPRPIGTSLRNRGVPLVGLNCATCHTGTIRDTPGGPPRVILGMPAHQFDLQSYQRFLFACIRDPGFTAERIVTAIQRVNRDFSWFDSIVYKLLVVPRTRRQGTELATRFAFFDRRPPQGPGRVDTFNPYKVMFNFDLSADESVGTADLPMLFDQRRREGLWLHWDGNNNAVTERNKSAAIGAGASETSLDLAAMRRIEDWILDLKPPAFPGERIDRAKAAAGRALFEQHCAECHEFGGRRTGQSLSLAEVGTDPERVNSFTAALAKRMNTIGTGRPWKFSHFRKTNGYAVMPLDGVWLRAPFLHNGSVPTLRDLLNEPRERPAVFWRGCDVYDYDAAGFI